MKKISLALIMLIIVGICVPAVSAANEPIVLIDSGTNNIYFDTVTTKNYQEYLNRIDIYRIQDWTDLKVVYYKPELAYLPTPPSIYLKNPSFSQPVAIKIGNANVGNGHIFYNVFYNSAGAISGAQFWLEVDSLDVSTYSGTQSLTLLPTDGNPLWGSTSLKILSSTGGAQASSDKPVGFAGSSLFGGTHLTRSEYYFENHITVNHDGVYIDRLFDGVFYNSVFTVDSDLGNLIDTSINNIELPYVGDGEWTVTNPQGRTFSGLMGSAVTDNDIVTVYIRNSQTGAAIANSRCVIDALVDGAYYPVVNRTEPSGIFSVTLQPTGGGSPNPDGYRLIASADGYNNPMPEINFTVDEYTTSIYCYLDPIAGGPIDENKTFIDFFVRDMSANPISGATINFGGYTLLTNSQGYTVFEVIKNGTYTYTVSKSGYGSLTGNAVIGADPRHTINTVLSPAVTPTTPTAIPTSTPISPTPTMTAPTGEPVSNWLEWFAAHFGRILGGGVEIGKIFMWLCFSVPVGVYVAKEAKAGAAGFMAGAGVVTLFFVLIGWVPIWLLVFIALIIGLLYAKIFNNSDNGGGR